MTATEWVINLKNYETDSLKKKFKKTATSFISINGLSETGKASTVRRLDFRNAFDYSMHDGKNIRAIEIGCIKVDESGQIRMTMRTENF